MIAAIHDFSRQTFSCCIMHCFFTHNCSLCNGVGLLLCLFFSLHRMTILHACYPRMHCETLLNMLLYVCRVLALWSLVDLRSCSVLWALMKCVRSSDRSRAWTPACWSSTSAQSKRYVSIQNVWLVSLLFLIEIFTMTVYFIVPLLL